MVTSAWRDTTEKEYQASLTPQERAAIQQQIELVKQQAEQGSRQWWTNFNNEMFKDQYSLFNVIVSFFAGGMLFLVPYRTLKGY